MVYNNLIMCLSSITINHWSGLVPVPLLPRRSRSVYFGDVSKTLGPRDPKPIGRAIAENLKEKSLLTYKVSNTFMRVPYRVLQSRNLESNFAQSRIPAFFQSRISPSFCFKIPNPELQIKEIPHPGKPISDTVWYNFIVHVLKHGKTNMLHDSNFSDVSFTPI